jgi:hypothetical protein
MSSRKSEPARNAVSMKATFILFITEAKYAGRLGSSATAIGMQQVITLPEREMLRCVTSVSDGAGLSGLSDLG